MAALRAAAPPLAGDGQQQPPRAHCAAQLRTFHTRCSWATRSQAHGCVSSLGSCGAHHSAPMASSASYRWRD
eukprot:269035-Alexandrium_andersonii.AAC.1